MAVTPNWSAILSNIMGGDFGVKVGPGVLLVIGRVAMAAFGAIAVLAWVLKADPNYVLAAIGLIIALVVYFCERSIRYAEKNPIPALMGGSELLKFLEHQMGARDNTIVKNDVQQIGAAKETAQAIEAGGNKP